MRRALTLLLVGALALTACSDDAAESATTDPSTTVTPDTSAPDTTAPDTTTPGTSSPDTSAPLPPDPARPYELFTPSSYTEGTPMPLVLLLHGYGASGAIQEAYFQVQPLAEERGFLFVSADGTKNLRGDQFWNATDACCGFGTSDVDDVAYLTAIIDQVSADRDVDPKRIYLMGHSNGGFMSYRMACDLSDRVAAIASLAGATFDDPAKCTPDEPVSVLQVHGTADGTIAYDGGTIPVVGTSFPGARTSVTTWAGYDGCDSTLQPDGTTLDLEPNLAGEETTVEEFGGCPDGVAVQLWSLEGGAHIPGIAFPDGSHPMTEGMVDFLLAHPKP